MAERVNHSTASAIATTGWETVKGGIVGAVGVGVVGAAVAGVIAAALLPMTAALVVAGVAGVATFSAAGPIAGAIGAIVGVFRGSSRVRRENEAYERRQEILSHAQAHQHNQVAQQAFTMGVQAGQQSVVEELQRAHAMMIQEEMAKQAKQNPVGPHTAKLAQERQNQVSQAVGAQVG